MEDGEVMAWPATIPSMRRRRITSSGILLHLPSSNKPEGVIKALLDVYPDAAKEKGYAGYLPFHYAAEKQMDAGAVKAILAAYPDAVKASDRMGALPLHSAASSNKSAAVVKVVLDAYPAALKEKDKGGMLPLHYAALNKAEPVVKMMYTAYPDAVMEADNHGKLPKDHFPAGRPASIKAILTEPLDQLRGLPPRVTQGAPWSKNPWATAAR